MTSISRISLLFEIIVVFILFTIPKKTTTTPDASDENFSESKKLTVVSGDTLKFRCMNEEDVTTKPLWKKGKRVLKKKLLTRESQGRIVMQEGEQVIYFHETKAEDSGIWKCFMGSKPLKLIILQVDVIKTWTDLRSPTNCIVWMSVVTTLLFVGIIVYLMRRDNKKKNKKSRWIK